MDDTKQYIKSYFSERGIDLTDKQIETIENMLIKERPAAYKKSTQKGGKLIYN